MEKDVGHIRFRIIWLSCIITIATGCVEVTNPSDQEGDVTYSVIASQTRTPFLPSFPTKESSKISTVLPRPEQTNALSTFRGGLSTQYSLIGTLDYPGHTLNVDEFITYINDTGGVLNTIVLAVEPNLWKGCFQLEWLSIQDLVIKDYSLSANKLEVPLAAPLFANETIVLEIHYDLVLPEANSQQLFGFNSIQINLVDWYPYIVPFSRNWLLHTPGEVGEHLVYDRADYDVTFSIYDIDPNTTVSASAPALIDGYKRIYHLDDSRRFVLSISNSLLVEEFTTGDIQVFNYYLPDDEEPAQEVLEKTSAALGVFSDLFGEFHYPSLSIVESNYFDGMESDGLFFLSRDFYQDFDSTVMNNLIDIAVHETAHQWWFGQVGNDQAEEPWLDEALSTYSELLYFEREGIDPRIWWQFRVTSFAPSGWVDTDIYHGKNFRLYANAVYLRGALFMDGLRRQMGDEEFYKFLKDYSSEMNGKTSSAKEFFRILRKYSISKLDELVKQYFLYDY